MATPPMRRKWLRLRGRVNQVTPKRQSGTPNRPTRLSGRKQTRIP